MFTSVPGTHVRGTPAETTRRRRCDSLVTTAHIALIWVAASYQIRPRSVLLWRWDDGMTNPAPILTGLLENIRR